MTALVELYGVQSNHLRHVARLHVRCWRSALCAQQPSHALHQVLVLGRARTGSFSRRGTSASAVATSKAYISRTHLQR